MSAISDAIQVKIAARISGVDDAALTRDIVNQMKKEDELQYLKQRKAYVKELLKEIREAKAQNPVDNDEVTWLQAELNSLKG